MIEVARRDRDNALLHLRIGFVAYRQGELGGGKPHYEDAAGEFEWATDLRPDWPWGWYGLGLAELALGEHDVILIENVRQLLGKDYLTKAANAFARATEADPAFAAAVIDLANTALTQRIHARLGVALAVHGGDANVVQLGSLEHRATKEAPGRTSRRWTLDVMAEKDAASRSESAANRFGIGAFLTLAVILLCMAYLSSASRQSWVPPPPFLVTETCDANCELARARELPRLDPPTCARDGGFCRIPALDRGCRDGPCLIRASPRTRS